METYGINHTGLAVRDLDATTRFFTHVLGWEESGRDDSYPRTSVSDGVSRLTLWQVASDRAPTDFDRRHNIGLHHLAIEVPSEAALASFAEKIATHPEANIEFLPEPMGAGPRKHMMFAELGGIQLELIWPGT
jgi:catechol 2,3-dioxygenase-like lactoylglutathione lyase family enzyme